MLATQFYFAGREASRVARWRSERSVASIGGRCRSITNSGHRNTATGAASRSAACMPGSGILFEEVSLDARIGAEAVALLIDPEADGLLGARLDLNLKAGIAPTRYGPIMFLIWWVPPFVDGLPSTLYEQVMNSLNPKTAVILRRLADQTHLHVLVIGPDGQVCNLFEYQNVFGFENLAIGASAARISWQGVSDFKLARRRFAEEYSLHDLLSAE